MKSSFSKSHRPKCNQLIQTIIMHIILFSILFEQSITQRPLIQQKDFGIPLSPTAAAALRAAHLLDVQGVEHCNLGDNQKGLEGNRGYFYDQITLKGRECFEGCINCVGADKKDCTILKTGYYRFEDEIRQGKSVENGYIGQFDRETQREMCMTGKSGYASISNNSKENPNEITMGKKGEVENCETCGIDTKKCQTCDPKYNLVGNNQGKLIEETKTGADWNNFSKMGNDCKEGNDLKFSIISKSCISCPRVCTNGYYQDVGISCIPGYTTHGPSIERKGVKGEVKNGKIGMDGPDACLTGAKGFFYNAKSNTCDPCHPKCTECSGPFSSHGSGCRFNEKKQQFEITSFDQEYSQQFLQFVEKKYPRLYMKTTILDQMRPQTVENYGVKECPNDELLSTLEGNYEYNYIENDGDSQFENGPTINVYFDNRWMVHKMMGRQPNELETFYGFTFQMNDNNSEETRKSIEEGKRRRKKLREGKWDPSDLNQQTDENTENEISRGQGEPEPTSQDNYQNGLENENGLGQAVYEGEDGSLATGAGEPV